MAGNRGFRGGLSGVAGRGLWGWLGWRVPLAGLGLGVGGSLAGLFSVGWGRCAGWLGCAGLVGWSGLVYCLSSLWCSLPCVWNVCGGVLLFLCEWVHSMRCAFSWCFWAIRRPSVFVTLSAVSTRVAGRMPLRSLSRIRSYTFVRRIEDRSCCIGVPAWWISL